MHLEALQQRQTIRAIRVPEPWALQAERAWTAEERMPRIWRIESTQRWWLVLGFGNYQPPITSHQSPATNHQPPATNHQPPATRMSSACPVFGIIIRVVLAPGVELESLLRALRGEVLEPRGLVATVLDARGQEIVVTGDGLQA